MRSSLAVVAFFTIMSESKKSRGTDILAEDMREFVLAIFAYIAANFIIE